MHRLRGYWHAPLTASQNLCIQFVCVLSQAIANLERMCLEAIGRRFGCVRGSLGASQSPVQRLRVVSAATVCGPFRADVLPSELKSELLVFMSQQRLLVDVPLSESPTNADRGGLSQWHVAVTPVQLFEMPVQPFVLVRALWRSSSTTK